MINPDNLTGVSLAQLLQTTGWQAQYRLIIQWGECITYKPDVRQEHYRIKGCETSAWLAHDVHESCHYFSFDSDSRVMNGLAALLLSLINQKITSELILVDINAIFRDVGLQRHLSPSRSNGLRAIIRSAYALAGCACVIE